MNLNRFIRFAAILLIVMVGYAAWWSWEFRLPVPEHCNRDQLFRWMALYDLADESDQTQLALMERFEELIKNGEDIDYVGASSVELIGPGESAGTYRMIEIRDGKNETIGFK